MVTLAPKSERRRQANFWKEFQVCSDNLRKDLSFRMDRYHVCEAGNPYFRLVSGLFNPLHTVDVKKLRVYRTLKKAKMQIFHARGLLLFCLSAFHVVLKQKP